MQSTGNIANSIPPGIGNLIFDLDGTFYPLYRMSLNMLVMFARHPRAAAKFYNARQKMRKIRWDDGTWTSRRVFLKRQAACASENPEYFDKYFYRVMRRRAIKLKPFDGVKQSLQILKDAGYKLYVYSDFPIDGKMDELGISSFFDGIYSSEDSGFLKPDPRGFGYLQSKIPGLTARNSLFIGDREDTDVRFAKNCGMAYAVVGDTWKWNAN